jgi:cyclase
MRQSTTLSVLDLGSHLLGFYDGRIPGVRYYSDSENWLDDGGFSLGICSYAVVDGSSAVVYDTHLSVAHATDIRHVLEDQGVRDIRVVLSHWHLDHIAGNAAFADCEIIAGKETARFLSEKRAAIAPLIMPTTVFDGEHELRCGDVAIELRPLDIHSKDGMALYLPQTRTILAGDTLEDTVTYVVEPDRLSYHLRDLERMSAWDIARILPNHGSKDRIVGEGYSRGLIDATRMYVERLISSGQDDGLAALSLERFIPEPLADGSITLFPPYEAVHRSNIQKVRAEVGLPVS